MLKYLLACGLVACYLGSPARSAPPAWEARFGLTAPNFEKTNKELAEKGYRPAQISVAALGKEVRFTVIWEKRGEGAELETQHDLTAKQLEKTVGEFKDKGFRPVDVCGYEVNGETRFAAVWEKAPKDALARESHVELTDDDYRKLYADLTKKGSRPLRVSGYAVGKEARYATVWEKEPKNGASWHTRRDLTSNQYQDVFDEQRDQKRRPIHVAGYTIDGQERFSAVWGPSPTPQWAARHELDQELLEKAIADLKAQGYRPLHVSGYAVDGKLRYAGVWGKE